MNDPATISPSHRLHRHARTVAAGMVQNQRGPSSRRLAVRAFLTVLIPLALLDATHLLPWALYVSFGAFTSIYAGPFPYRGRWRMQSAMGAVMVAATTCGALVGASPWRDWLSIPVSALWAAGAMLASDRFSLTPPGPLFPVFAVSACAAVPGGARQVTAALVTCSATAVMAVVFGLLDERLAAVQGVAPDRPTPRSRPLHRERVHAARMGAAVALAGTLATGLAGLGLIGHPYWAMVSAVVPLVVVRLRDQTVRAAQRAVGTTVGILVAYLILTVDPPAPLVVLTAACLQGLAEITVPMNYGWAMIFVTPLALVMGHLAHPTDPGRLVLDRFVETVIGVLMGLAVAYLTRATRPARR